jgi:hypothetical protein
VYEESDFISLRHVMVDINPNSSSKYLNIVLYPQYSCTKYVFISYVLKINFKSVNQKPRRIYSEKTGTNEISRYNPLPSAVNDSENGLWAL